MRHLLVILGLSLLLVVTTTAQDEDTGVQIVLEAGAGVDAVSLVETQQIIETRLAEAGYESATVQTVGAYWLLVDVPAVAPDAVDSVVRLIQSQARLEFVDFAGITEDYIDEQILTTSQDDLLQERLQRAEERGESLDELEQTLATYQRNPLTGQPFETVMTGDGLAAVGVSFHDASMSWGIDFEIAEDHEILIDGFETFGDYTEARIGEPLAIVLDGIVISAPQIFSRLDTGGVISGQFTEDEARALALQLRSGALSVPLEVVSVRTYGTGPEPRLDVTFDRTIALEDYTLDRETGLVTLTWRALEPIDRDYVVFVHAIAGRDIVAQFDVPVMTTGWTPGEQVETQHPLTIPPDADPEAIYAGLYQPFTGIRAFVIQDGQLRDDNRAYVTDW
jgi:hypothetical protein